MPRPPVASASLASPSIACRNSFSASASLPWFSAMKPSIRALAGPLIVCGGFFACSSLAVMSASPGWVARNVSSDGIASLELGSQSSARRHAAVAGSATGALCDSAASRSMPSSLVPSR